MYDNLKDLKANRHPILSLLSIAAIISVWFFITQAGIVKPIFLPAPTRTAQALWSLLTDGRFFGALLVSFTRIAVATMIAVVIGTCIGVFMGISSRAEAIFSPITQSLRYLPITALIPLLVLWFGIGESMKISFLVFGITFYFVPLVRNAIRTVPQEFIDAALSFGASYWTLAKEVYWKQALPQIFDGLIVVNGIGWTYVILAEIVNAKDGLGYLIYIAGRLQRSDEVFAGLILIAVVAITSDRILQYFRHKKLFW